MTVVMVMVVTTGTGRSTKSERRQGELSNGNHCCRFDWGVNES